MDLDGDGIISLYEMQYFYEDQVQKMMELGMETLNFEDCLCQVCSLKCKLYFKNLNNQNISPWIGNTECSFLGYL